MKHTCAAARSEIRLHSPHCALILPCGLKENLEEKSCEILRSQDCSVMMKQLLSKNL
jgi:hypothetical protein